MRKRRYITIVVVGAILAISAGAAEAKSLSLHVGLSFGHSIARPIMRSSGWVSPRARTVVVTSPFRSRIAPRRYHHRTVVVRRPCVKTVVVAPRPRRVVTTKTVIVEPAVVTVWLRNSNGSQSSVKLTRSGPGYMGPRGEYYSAMPDNEQLRMVYGF